MPSNDEERRHAQMQECEEIAQNTCLFTAVSLLIWLRVLRQIKVVAVVTPVLLASLATWTLLTSSNHWASEGIVAIAAFLAALIPAMYLALNFDEQLSGCRTLAGEYTNLRHRFRQAARVASAKTLAEFEQDFERLMDRLEEANRKSYTAPEWCFKRARKKIEVGDYTHDQLR